MDTNGDIKMLLLKDLCSRLPYGVKCNRYGNVYQLVDIDIKREIVYLLRDDNYVPYSVLRGDIIKPYLRPLSSMTEEEKEELIKNFWGSHTAKDTFEELSWYLSKHFDINGLIPKGLAIEVTEDNNPYKE